MEISAKKSQMLYKNERGGRIMLRISLPEAERECDLNELYRVLCESYRVRAKKYIDTAEGNQTMFLDVYYDLEKKKKDVIIKRTHVIKRGTKVLKSKTSKDIFDSESLSLKG